jgi:hypothetical protein
MVAHIFPRWNPLTKLDAPNRTLPESRVRRFAKAARNQRTGLKFTISGPFVICFVVGVGWRMTGFGPRLGILQPTPMCTSQAHVVLSLQGVKYFAWDDAKNAKLRKERGIGFEDIIFYIERGDLLNILEHPNPRSLRVHQRVFVVQRDDYVFLVPFPPSPAARRIYRGSARRIRRLMAGPHATEPRGADHRRPCDRARGDFLADDASRSRAPSAVSRKRFQRGLAVARIAIDTPSANAASTTSIHRLGSSCTSARAAGLTAVGLRPRNPRRAAAAPSVLISQDHSDADRGARARTRMTSASQPAAGEPGSP